MSRMERLAQVGVYRSSNGSRRDKRGWVPHRLEYGIRSSSRPDYLPKASSLVDISV